MIAMSTLGGTAANAAPSDADGARLMAKYNCVSCHTVDKRLVGPAFRDIAMKYAGDATAGDKLQSKIKSGSTGVWGPIPMPPNSVSDADLKALVEWILSLK
jgi:cytochrome c